MDQKWALNLQIFVALAHSCLEIRWFNDKDVLNDQFTLLKATSSFFDDLFSNPHLHKYKV